MWTGANSLLELDGRVIYYLDIIDSVREEEHCWGSMFPPTSARLLSLRRSGFCSLLRAVAMTTATSESGRIRVISPRLLEDNFNQQSFV